MSVPKHPPSFSANPTDEPSIADLRDALAVMIYAWEAQSTKDALSYIGLSGDTSFPMMAGRVRSTRDARAVLAAIDKTATNAATTKAASLDDKGRCCGRKPAEFKRPQPRRFCGRCNRAYGETGQQISNWAWTVTGDLSVPRYPLHAHAETAASHRPDPRPAAGCDDAR